MRNEFSGMDFLVWVGARRGALGAVRGGRPRDVVDLLIETSAALPAIIGDRTSNEDILASRVLNGGPRPRMQVSRGLRHDLPAIVTASRDGPVLVVPRITNMYVRDERQRIAAQIRAVAGYEAPRAVLDIVAVDRVAATFRDALRHLSAPLLIHDAAAQFPRTSLSGFSVFGYPVTETIDDDDATMDVEPSEDAITDQARFLARTDLATLKSMHAPFMNASDFPLFTYWDGRLEALLADGAEADLAERARRVLAAIQVRLSDNRPVGLPPAQPGPEAGQRMTSAKPATMVAAAAPPVEPRRFQRQDGVGQREESRPVSPSTVGEAPNGRADPKASAKASAAKPLSTPEPRPADVRRLNLRPEDRLADDHPAKVAERDPSTADVRAPAVQPETPLRPAAPVRTEVQARPELRGPNLKGANVSEDRKISPSPSRLAVREITHGLPSRADKVSGAAVEITPQSPRHLGTAPQQPGAVPSQPIGPKDDRPLAVSVAIETPGDDVVSVGSPLEAGGAGLAEAVWSRTAEPEAPKPRSVFRSALLDETTENGQPKIKVVVAPEPSSNGRAFLSRRPSKP